MPLPQALLFGSIGTICETTELQRHAFNAAFKEADLDWHWERRDYGGLLKSPSGARRIAHYASDRGEDVDVARLHRRSSEIFQEMLRRASRPLRPGVADTVIAARKLGIRLAFVTTTSIENVEAMLDASEPRLFAEDFSFIGHSDLVKQPKPATDIYLRALKALRLLPEQAMAIEDTPECAEAAIGAGIPTIAFPGSAHLDRDFSGVTKIVTALSPSAIGLDAEMRV